MTALSLPYDLSSFLAETRSSNSLTATLSDYSVGSFVTSAIRPVPPAARYSLIARAEVRPPPTMMSSNLVIEGVGAVSCRFLTS